MKVSRMSDEKAMRYADWLRQYCSERPCKNGECVFQQKKSGICPLKDTRVPADWRIDDIRQERLNE